MPSSISAKDREGPADINSDDDGSDDHDASQDSGVKSSVKRADKDDASNDNEHVSHEHGGLVSRAQLSQTGEPQERPTTPPLARSRWSQIGENVAEQARRSREENKRQAMQDKTEGGDWSAGDSSEQSKYSNTIDQGTGELTRNSYRIKSRSHQGESCRIDGQQAVRTRQQPRG